MIFDEELTEDQNYVSFKCTCGIVNTVVYDHADALDFHCKCGEYYSKLNRIADHQIISYKKEEWNFEIVDGHTPICLGGGNCGGFPCEFMLRDTINEPLCRVHYYEEKELQKKKKSFWYKFKRSVGIGK